MYSWIWRHLPFGLPGRLVGSLLIVFATAALLWYLVFPNVEQYMPFTDGQVTSDTGGPGADQVTPSGAPLPGLLPNNPSPTASR